MVTAPTRCAVLLACFLSPCVALAEADQIRLREIGDAVDRLINDTTCRDFMNVLEGADATRQSTADVLTVVLGLVFMTGFGAGSGLDADAGTKWIMGQCMANPDTLLSEISPPG